MGFESHPANSAGGPLRDDADQERLRHGRKQHDGFAVGRYLQPAPMLFTRDGHNVFLGDMYRGFPAFLICGGPSLITHDLTRLSERGILTCAVNNAATVLRPQLWVSVDDPGNFADAIWRDPGIMKFVPLCHMEKHFLNRDAKEELVPSVEFVGDMPAVFGYRRNEAFVAEQFLFEDTFNWGNHSQRFDAYGNKGSRSVMLVALRLLFYLGVRRVYLLGCDFKMSHGRENYAFEQDRSRSSIAGNNSSYDVLNVRLKFLKPHFDEEGFEVLNCTPNSGLRVFPHVEFEEAIEYVTLLQPSKIVTAGMYDRKQRDKNEQDHGAETVDAQTRDADTVDAETRDAEKTVQSAPVAIVRSSQAVSSSPVTGATQLPDTTLVTAVDQDSIEVLRHTFPTWIKFRPWLNELSIIVIHDSDMEPGSPQFEFLRNHANVRFVTKPVDKRGHWRDRWTRAYFEVPAEHVTTPWYLKLEPEAISTNDQPWVFSHWFDADAEQTPVHISCPWNYTRPSTVISDLDDWADRIPGLADFPRLELPYDRNEDRIHHSTISSWCFFGSTAWTKEVLPYLHDDVPCQAHDTLAYYFAMRRHDHFLRKRIKDYGWEHSFGRRRHIAARCQEVLAS